MMARLPKYMKTEYVGKRQLDNGRWVANFDLHIAWWGWVSIFLRALWGIVQGIVLGRLILPEHCDGLAIREVKWEKPWGGKGSGGTPAE